MDNIQAVIQNAIPILTYFVLKVIGAFILWIIGRRLIDFGTRLLVRSLKFPFDQTVASYIGTAVKVAVTERALLICTWQVLPVQARPLPLQPLKA